MKKLFLNEFTWNVTFPHLVTPLQDEWLPGLLLRCDAANHWESGMATTHLFRSTSRSLLRGRKGKPNWIVVPLSALEYMAQVLAIPVSTLLATTYQKELMRLYACPRITTYSRKAQERKDCSGEASQWQIKQVEHYELTKASLGYLIDLLVSLKLSPMIL